MSCIFRVSGDNLDIDSLLSTIEMQPYKVWRRGEPRRKTHPRASLYQFSGASFLASNADFSEFDLQVAEAMQFLESNQQDISIMGNFQGVEGLRLDFGIEFRDVAIHGDFLPSKFLVAAGSAGIDVLLSHYPCPEEDEESEQAAPSNGG